MRNLIVNLKVAFYMLKADIRRLATRHYRRIAAKQIERDVAKIGGNWK